MKLSRYFAHCFLFLALSACHEHQAPHLPSPDLKAHRVGRHLIDLPAEFRSSSRASAEFIPDSDNPLRTKMQVEIVALGTSQQQFDRAAAAREKELIAAGTDVEDALTATLNKPDGSVLFRIMRVKNSYIGELDTLVGDTYVRVTGKSHDRTFEQAEAAIVAFAKHIVPRDAGTPTDFSLGPVSITGSNSEESAEFYYRSAQRPDLRIEIAIDTFLPNSGNSLLARMSGDDSLVKAFDIKHRVLRKGDISVAGMPAQEWLGVARLGSEEGGTQYNFALETRRPAPGLFAPALRVQLMSGQYSLEGEKQPNSLDDDSALQLWDGIVKSIRRADKPRTGPG